MISSEAKNRIENIWDVLWSSGVKNPLAIVEQVLKQSVVSEINMEEIIG